MAAERRAVLELLRQTWHFRRPGCLLCLENPTAAFRLLSTFIPSLASNSVFGSIPVSHADCRRDVGFRNASGNEINPLWALLCSRPCFCSQNVFVFVFLNEEVSRVVAAHRGA